MAKIIDFFDGSQSSTTPVITGGGSGSPVEIEVRTITIGESAAKQLTLGAAPGNPGEVLLNIAGAPTQIYGTDYTVSGLVLSWTGLALDGILSTGDKITIIYNT
jgi:hypothetical protein